MVDGLAVPRERRDSRMLTAFFPEDNELKQRERPKIPGLPSTIIPAGKVLSLEVFAFS